MSEEKLSSDEVPEKFTEWLLAMGCPAEKVLSVVTMTEMCRGQYYMVWRSLMEQVDARDRILSKRQQVFCDMVRRGQKNNGLVPVQLSLWKEQADLSQKVEDAKARVALAKRDLDQIVDKNNSKLCQREMSRRRVSAVARRVWFLRQVAADLKQKTIDLKETQSIADSLCSLDSDDDDLQSKLEKCIASFRRQHSHPVALSASNTSVVSTNEDNDLEERVWSAVRSGGGAMLCEQLASRRARTVRALASLSTGKRTSSAPIGSIPQSVLAHTAALHCTLSLEATKNKLHLQQTRRKLVDTIAQLNNYLSGPTCELLVLSCEQAYWEGRAGALRGLLAELQAGGGVFSHHREPVGPPASTVAALDKIIESKKEEVKRTIAMLCSTERKIQSARECLSAALAAFRDDVPAPRTDHHTGIQVDFPVESIAGLREFYWSRRARTHHVSLDWELSDGSLTDDYSNPRFVDELRIYLKKFNLDHNRQLVLENGEKIYTFETVQSSIQRFQEQWLKDEASCSILSPIDNLRGNISRLVENVETRADLEAMVKTLKCREKNNEIDIKPQIRQEEEITDRTKKRLRENLTELQKVVKTFAASQDDIKLWADNKTSKYIAHTRTIDGMTYRDYEKYYLENCFSV